MNAMEERVILPFMTAQEEEVYRRYYGEHNLPPRQNLHVQYASVRRPSYPPTQTSNVQDNRHYGETSSEMIGGLGLAYVSTPNFDTSLRPPSPNTIVIPDHVRLSNDSNSNAKKINDESESFYRQRPASPNTITIPDHVRLSNDGYSNPSPMLTQQANIVNQHQTASPNTITIPSHARLSQDDYTGPRPVYKKPEKELITFKQRLMGRTNYASRGDKPSTMRHFLRSLQFLSAALVLILAILTNTVTHKP
ncbi:hypothetical protein DSO57_1005367 [Entomophthora muscae]|uniref:Uncharacterized protein n=1 Tax=Entomophthora muscae TaxID=34485 RepID=A0ACC2SA47_9FUNG|nr:hypothetical protein DSO57_1005367 [Entomophthora muscae]